MNIILWLFRKGSTIVHYDVLIDKTTGDIDQLNTTVQTAVNAGSVGNIPTIAASTQAVVTGSKYFNISTQTLLILLLYIQLLTH